MKHSIIFVLCLFTVALANAQKGPARKVQVDTVAKKQIVEAACGQCRLGLEGNGCDLAVRINGKAYFVDGTKIDDHGDAHAKDGFCNAIRNAEVTGIIVNNRFQATSFKLVKPVVKKE
jgi:Family of unknown function (DUF6370)